MCGTASHRTLHSLQKITGHVKVCASTWTRRRKEKKRKEKKIRLWDSNTMQMQTLRSSAVSCQLLHGLKSAKAHCAKQGLNINP
jgi:hypothetical protein